MQTTKKTKKKLSVIFRDPTEVPHRKGTFINHNCCRGQFNGNK